MDAQQASRKRYDRSDKCWDVLISYDLREHKTIYRTGLIRVVTSDEFADHRNFLQKHRFLLIYGFDGPGRGLRKIL
jgi:hypothetical protein